MGGRGRDGIESLSFIVFFFSSRDAVALPPSFSPHFLSLSSARACLRLLYLFLSLSLSILALSLCVAPRISLPLLLLLFLFLSLSFSLSLARAQFLSTHPFPHFLSPSNPTSPPPLNLYSSNFRKMIELLCPPNPKELDKATLVSLSSAGTDDDAHIDRWGGVLNIQSRV